MTRPTRAAWAGLGVTIALIAVAAAVPPLTGWAVHSLGVAPLHGPWQPRVGPGTPAAILLAVAAVVFAPRITRWPWWRLQVVVVLAGIGWMLSLATVDGWAGIAAQLDHGNDYLPTARTITDVGAMLREFVARIPFSAAPHNWPVHVAGHPPGAVLFFVLLVRLGLGSAIASGLVIVLLASTTAVAVLTTMRRLGGEEAARRSAPFLVIAPAAIWMASTGDAVFAAVAAWALCTLALAATSVGVRARVWAGASGILFGVCLLMSYGLALVAVLALAVLVLARSLRPLPWVVAGVVLVVGGFAVAGFAWWEALPVLTRRYWDGLASSRPAAYWTWANLAAFAVSTGPIAGAAVATAGAAAAARLTGARPPLPRAAVVAIVLCLAAVTTVLLADASQMSRAEVERIWLPFVPWTLVGTALLTPRWQRWGLAGQAVFALLVEHLVKTGW
ncbi:membrane protein [Microbacterium mangrovi]|uniref:Membrane protein n=1 Tax=Microbacterium mangrovi TaxID=1348253 RepID=A0A0B2A9T5_9MICO|nr:glycosyltransferase family 39 protein [Microbacterium mangrovi]KHK98287.1 membrane protein [Microbacterium mangrovi]